MTKLKLDRPHVIILDKCCQKGTHKTQNKTNCLASYESFYKNNLQTEKNILCSPDDQWNVFCDKKQNPVIYSCER